MGTHSFVVRFFIHIVFSDVPLCNQLIKELDEYKIELDPIACTKLLDALAKAGKWEICKSVFADIKTRGTALDTELFNVMLQHSRSERECFEYV